LSDVSKDKPPSRAVESNTTQFMKALESVETSLSKHIGYLTTVSTGVSIIPGQLKLYILKVAFTAAVCSYLVL